MSLCPCGTQKIYKQCCGLLLEDKQLAQTPEQLMRSRYTAYSMARVDYIKNTMSGKPLISFNESEARTWAKKVIWIGLEVIQSYMETPHKGFVEFAASFIDHNRLQTIHELSEFHKENDRWLYVDGINRQLSEKNNKKKLGRNSPCPCGSNKKFKNCHEK